MSDIKRKFSISDGIIQIFNENAETLPLFSRCNKRLLADVLNGFSEGALLYNETTEIPVNRMIRDKVTNINYKCSIVDNSDGKQTAIQVEKIKGSLRRCESPINSEGTIETTQDFSSTTQLIAKMNTSSNLVHYTIQNGYLIEFLEDNTRKFTHSRLIAGEENTQLEGGKGAGYIDAENEDADAENGDADAENGDADADALGLQWGYDPEGMLSPANDFEENEYKSSWDWEKHLDHLGKLLVQINDPINIVLNEKEDICIRINEFPAFNIKNIVQRNADEYEMLLELLEHTTLKEICCIKMYLNFNLHTAIILLQEEASGLNKTWIPVIAWKLSYRVKSYTDSVFKRVVRLYKLT